jgi:hypothetical protein
VEAVVTTWASSVSETNVADFGKDDLTSTPGKGGITSTMDWVSCKCGMSFNLQLLCTPYNKVL